MMTTVLIVVAPEDVALGYTGAGRDISITPGYVVSAGTEIPGDLRAWRSLEHWAVEHDAVRDSNGRDPLLIGFPVTEDPDEWDRAADAALQAEGLRRTGPWRPSGLLIAAPAEAAR